MIFDTAFLQLGNYIAEASRDAVAVAEAQEFRARCFELKNKHDIDPWDKDCTHVLIRDCRSDILVCCFRLSFYQAVDVSQSYSAQYYGLGALHHVVGTMMELGRFCIASDRYNPDVLRLAWASMAYFVDRQDVSLLFGCTSFRGTSVATYKDALRFLRAKALAPAARAPRRKAREIVSLNELSDADFDVRCALRQTPPLLRTYLGMGGWVSDHAVIDREMNTLHVFTGVETATIPENRQHMLRRLCQTAQLQHGVA